MRQERIQQMVTAKDILFPCIISQFWSTSEQNTDIRDKTKSFDFSDFLRKENFLEIHFLYFKLVKEC